MKKKNTEKNFLIISRNKRAKYNTYIKKEMEAGLSLKGWEVKSLRSNNISISTSYVTLKSSSAYLTGAVFQSNTNNNMNFIYEKERNIQLLLHKHEINSLFGYVKIKGYSIVVISLYWKYHKAKLKIGIAKGKKKIDKRLEIKKREWEIKKSRLFKKNKIY
ncbi:smpB [Wigglesworthia glossinidia endosymbiont of Glossina brevipalpis]|uniref:SsrA-binding protein n=1 Tax=Wigglesworthia glossinidia brevipalpis TaxID=36870 RepID=Q8D389_WIGBR|nr:smpB [Wigglesworthia glossinidia endosymbiont of Glossina brevipalpis]